MGLGSYLDAAERDIDILYTKNKCQKNKFRSLCSFADYETNYRSSLISSQINSSREVQWAPTKYFLVTEGQPAMFRVWLPWSKGYSLKAFSFPS